MVYQALPTHRKVLEGKVSQLTIGIPTSPVIGEVRDLLRQIQSRPQWAYSPDAERLLFLKELCPDDPELAALLSEEVQAAEILKALYDNPLTETAPATAGLLPGSILLGRIIPYGVPWLLNPQEFLTHVLFSGRSGIGKTNAMILAAGQLLQLGYSEKIFDRKGDFGCLCHFRQFSNLMPEHIGTNMLEPPPGMSFEQWVPILAEIIGNTANILFAGRGYFVRNALLAREKLLNQGIGLNPTFRDVISSMESDRAPALSKIGQYRDTVIHRLRSLIDVFGDSICSQRRLDWNVYANAPWAISLQGYPTDCQNFYIAVTVAKLLLHRMLTNRRSSSLCDVIILDEAQTMFRRQYEKSEGTYLLLDYLAQAREFGIGFLIGTQTLSQLADTVIANTATKIFMASGLGKDYEVFASAAALDSKKVEFLKRNQMPGFACVKDPRYPYAFTVEVPRVVQ